MFAAKTLGTQYCKGAGHRPSWACSSGPRSRPQPHGQAPPRSRVAPQATPPGVTIELASDGSLIFRFADVGPATQLASAASDSGAEGPQASASHADTEVLELRAPPQAAAAILDAAGTRDNPHPVAAVLETAAEQLTSAAVQLETAADPAQLRHHRDQSASSSRSALAAQASQKKNSQKDSRDWQPGSNRHPPAGPASPLPQQHEPSAAPALMQHGVDVAAADTLTLLGLFSDLANHHRLADALGVVEALVMAKRRDVLHRLRHKHFLRAAEAARDVHSAQRFVQLLPRGAADARTYTMLVSVCTAAGDAHAALQAVDMWRSTGRKPDTILYTNVITACAGAGDSEAANAVYQQMRAEKLPLERHVFSALIAAYAASVQAAGAADRRTHLVLLERAFHLIDDMKEAKVQPDAIVYNGLITLAGRVGQLQRAFDVVSEMEAHHCRPDAHTFSSLIDACSRADNQELGLKVYAKALRSGVRDSRVVYASAIAACKVGAAPNAVEAMTIYGQMQSNGVEADAQLFGTLMSVAGAAGNVDLAFSLLDEMDAEGMHQCSGTLSALLTVCIANNQLERARQVYQSMRARQLVPQMRAFNALIAATGRAFRLGDTVHLVQDLVAAGRTPDAFTYAALLAACQRAEEAELAFDLYRLMKVRGIKVGEAHCFALLRLCYNCIRALWRPGGYPPTATAHTMHPGSMRSPEGTALLEALSGSCRPPAEAATSAADWRARALAVYRDALAAGPPRLHVLDRLLACLREPRPANPKVESASAHAFKVDGLPWANGGMASAAEEQAPGIWGGHAEKAVVLLDEAIVLGALPSFKLGKDCWVDLRSMPPNVAEVYVLAVLQQLQRRGNPRSRVEHSITFQVPAYDPTDVFSPSYCTPASVDDVALQNRQMDSEEEDEKEQKPAGVTSSRRCAVPLDDFVAGPTTGLGVAAALRRLRLYASERPADSIIDLSARELTRWSRATARAEANTRAKPKLNALWEPGRLLNTPVARQARDIRMQEAAVAGKGGPSWQSVLQAGGADPSKSHWKARQEQRRQGRSETEASDDSGFADSSDGSDWMYGEAA